MSDEIFGILNDADEVMESVGYDPLGMNFVIEASAVSDKTMDKIDKYDLSNEEDITKLRTQLKKLNNIKIALKIWSKLNIIAAIGSTALGVSASIDSEDGNGVATGAIIGLIAIVSGQISKLIAKHIESGKEGQLIYITKSLDSTISQLEGKLSSAKGPDRERIQKQIADAQSFKNKIDAQLGVIGSNRQDANTAALNRIGNAGYANAATRLASK